MCLATVYVEQDGQRRQVMEDVAYIQPKDDIVQLITFLGETRQFQTRIKSVDLVNGSIVLEEESA